MRDPQMMRQWKDDCMRWRGKVLKGPDWHWCADWDELPIDAFTPEYDCCVCYKKTLLGRICNKIYMWNFNRHMNAVRKTDE